MSVSESVTGSVVSGGGAAGWHGDDILYSGSFNYWWSLVSLVAAVN